MNEGVLAGGKYHLEVRCTELKQELQNLRGAYQALMRAIQSEFGADGLDRVVRRMAGIDLPKQGPK
jgi:hypothetical protein